MLRGRQRAVSEAARARQRSEERARPERTRPEHTRPEHTRTRTPPLTSRSPSPPSSASLSPRSPASRSPTPPLTLSDQVHIAYAHDDIHLAKVLLLRLQGIEVTSDSDPRIAAVKDEDFDACFIPFGRLDDGRGNLTNIKSIPAAAPVSDARRADALRAKERLWDSEARRYTEERARCAAMKRRQTDQVRAASLEQERVRLIKQKEAAAAAVDLRRRRMKPTARTLNFSLIAPVPQPPPKFTYDFPFTTRNIAPRPPPAPTPTPPRRSPIREPPAPSPTREPPRVPFQQVLAAMQGPLFPALPSDRPLTTRDRRQRALLDALLAADVDLSSSRKGKARARAEPLRCAICTPPAPSLPSPTPSSPSTSSSGLSRAGSWLSFGGSSASSSSRSSLSASTAASSWVSASTLLSSPADSPTPPHKPAPFWLPGARRTLSPAPVAVSAPAHLCASHCECPRLAALTHPLLPPPSAAPPRHPPQAALETRAGAGAGPAGNPIPFTLALGRLVSLARNLQAAYVRAVVVGYGGVSPAWDDGVGGGELYAGDYGYGYAEPKQNAHAPPPTPALASKLRPAPAGRRVSRADVRHFLAPVPLPSPSHSIDADSDAATLAPSARLSPLAPKPAPHVTERRTQHAPWALVFPPPPPLPRSPWAAGPVRRVVLGEDEAGAPVAVASDEDAEGDGSEQWGTYARPPALRARAVPNSAFLRLKALHNRASGVRDSLRESPHGSKNGYASTSNASHTAKGAPRSPSPSSRNSIPNDTPRAPATVRKPRESLVALGVDRAPGSGLRFVYACVDAVV
ncbi:hypothetical protein DFH09DRAFT_1302694 [Mycena vulgaris]|nr:hypothetical protein DFH09DRAFT_1302694 [Mycena vulgaris]